METHPDSQPATKGDLRHLEKHADTRIDAVKAHADTRIDAAQARADTRIDAVEKNQTELRADFRSFSSSKYGLTSLIISGVVGAIVTAAIAILVNQHFS